jgi:hypothetical protein
MRSIVILFLITFCLPVFAKTLGPSEYLLAGEHNMNNQNWAKAIFHFESAISSRQLSPPGLTMAYWSIYIAGQSLKNKTYVANGLIGFIIYGTDSLKYDNPKIKQWAEAFKIEPRLVLAKTKLDAIWASQNKLSCRSKLFSCYLKNKKYIKYYQQALGACGVLKVSQNKTMAVSKCLDGSIEKYYFYHD